MTQQAAPGTDYPGKTLGIVGLIVAIFANLIGLIISIIAFNQSKKAGFKNTPALAGIIVGAVLTALGIIIAIFSIVAAVAAVNAGTAYMG
jgi:hypothetical protein